MFFDEDLFLNVACVIFYMIEVLMFVRGLSPNLVGLFVGTVVSATVFSYIYFDMPSFWVLSWVFIFVFSFVVFYKRMFFLFHVDFLKKILTKVRYKNEPEAIADMFIKHLSSLKRDVKVLLLLKKEENTYLLISSDYSVDIQDSSLKLIEDRFLKEFKETKEIDFIDCEKSKDLFLKDFLSGVRPKLLVPLLFDGKFYGFIGLEYPQRSDFLRFNLQFVLSFSTLFSMLINAKALEKDLDQLKNLFEKIKYQERKVSQKNKLLQKKVEELSAEVAEAEKRLRMLYDISERLLLRRPTEEVFRELVKILASYALYENVYILIRSPQDLTFRIVAYKGKELGYDFKLDPKNPVGIWGWVVMNKKTYMTGDVANDPYYVEIDPSVKSEIAVPVVVYSEVRAILDIQSKMQNAFSKRDVEFLECVARHIGGALEELEHLDCLTSVLEKMKILHEIVQRIASSINLEEMFEKLVVLLVNKFKYPYVNLFVIIEKDGEYIVKLVSSNVFDRRDFEEISKKIRAYGGGIVKEVATEQAIINLADPKKVKLLSVVEGVKSVLGVPIVQENVVLGVLVVESDEVNAFSKEDEEILGILAKHVAIEWLNFKLIEALQIQSMKDPMTGVWNLRYLHTRLREEISRARRYKRKFSILVCDLHNFKEVNDTYGHLVGDVVLKEVAERILREIRSCDTLARYGGDEFVLILPETDKSGAMVIAERIKSCIKEVKVGNKVIKVGIDIGIAVYPDDGERIEELLSIADRRMYEDKVSNRGLLSENNM